MNSTTKTSPKKKTLTRPRAGVVSDNNLHVKRDSGGQWMVKTSSSSQVISVHDAQAEAVDAARKIVSKDADIIVHSSNGRARHIVSKSPADEMMLDYWKSLHAESSTEKNKVRKAS